MRVLVISDHADPLAPPGVGYHGGQNVYIRDLATQVAARGVAVDVVTRRDDAGTPAVERIADQARVLRVTAGPSEAIPRDRFSEFQAKFTQGCLDVYDAAGVYDVVHSHYWYSGLAGMHLAAQRGIGLVHSFLSVGAVRHAAARVSGMAIDVGQAADREAAERRIAGAADVLTAYCPLERDHLLRLLGAAPHRIRVVPPGIDTTQLYPHDPVRSRMSLGLPTGSPVVLFVGRLEWRKGVSDLLRAFDIIRSVHIDAVLVIVGGGGPADPQWRGVRLEVSDRGLDPVVRMVGSVPRHMTPLYYSAADVTVMPSHYEPFGLVAVDSFACGTPVVASRVGCLEWIVEGVSECAEPRDPDDLAARIAMVLSNGRQAYTSRCLERVNDRYTIQRWAAELVDIYRSLAGA